MPATFSRLTVRAGIVGVSQANSITQAMTVTTATGSTETPRPSTR